MTISGVTACRIIENEIERMRDLCPTEPTRRPIFLKSIIQEIAHSNTVPIEQCRRIARILFIVETPDLLKALHDSDVNYIFKILWRLIAIVLGEKRAQGGTVFKRSHIAYFHYLVRSGKLSDSNLLLGYLADAHREKKASITEELEFLRALQLMREGFLKMAMERFRFVVDKTDNVSLRVECQLRIGIVLRLFSSYSQALTALDAITQNHDIDDLQRDQVVWEKSLNLMCLDQDPSILKRLISSQSRIFQPKFVCEGNLWFQNFCLHDHHVQSIRLKHLRRKLPLSFTTKGDPFAYCAIRVEELYYYDHELSAIHVAVKEIFDCLGKIGCIRHELLILTVLAGTLQSKGYQNLFRAVDLRLLNIKSRFERETHGTPQAVHQPRRRRRLLSSHMSSNLGAEQP